jgi:hypothetical protein
MKKILITILAALLLTGCWETKNGEKIGTVVKLAKEGIICKTWEGEIIRGGMNNGSGSFGTRPFYFTVESPELLKKIQNALDSQKEIKIKYHQELITFCRTETDDYFIDDIEIMR